MTPLEIVVASVCGLTLLALLAAIAIVIAQADQQRIDREINRRQQHPHQSFSTGIDLAPGMDGDMIALTYDICAVCGERFYVYPSAVVATFI